jgi:DHA1 family tetracycline resistance protein-like MFS transporter
MKKSSLGTLFLTVFLDLLGYGLVVPFLPAVARHYGASDSVAALIGTAYSLMQFLFIPVWGRLSDRIGRRPVMLISIAASALSMATLGVANSLPLLFAARLLSGAATANVAVAQAYIADVTDEKNRAQAMGMIGVGFGLGFVFGPFVGGELASLGVFSSPGALPALVAAALSAVNFVLALRSLPESLPPELRGRRVRSASPFNIAGFRQAVRVPGIPAVLLVNFLALLAFSGMEYTFALFTGDAFGMGVKLTGRVLGLVGLTLIVVQGLLIKPLARSFGESRLIRAGVIIEAGAFLLMGHSASFAAEAVPALFLSAGLIAVANGFINPSVPSYASRLSDRSTQGTTLGVLQSLAALARVLGPVVAGVTYQAFGHLVMFEVLAAQLVLAAVVSAGLRAIELPARIKPAEIAGQQVGE